MMTMDETHRTSVLPSEAVAAIEVQRSPASPARPQVVFAIPKPRSGYQNTLKPAMDAVGAILLLIVAALPMLLIGIAVRVSLGPPNIFRQTRVGQNGKLFTVYKFRTMIVDRRVGQYALLEVDRRESHKCDDDPRVTRLGRLLRRWGLDELPQLWNVLRGDMSLVGPRPEIPSIVADFAPWQHERHAVKPGLTGFWQVYARGDGTMMQERTDLDIAYVHSIGLRTDLKVLVLTIPAILGLKRGY
jgi:lipopolysaccharide/colanic/teichoic acid biosynthesis glycosyltransferase